LAEAGCNKINALKGRAAPRSIPVWLRAPPVRTRRLRLADTSIAISTRVGGLA
jgi:hypothetical protein